ncbi:MAG: endonuclease III [Candidatus Omnitrophota bacterium]|nr:endonuclease III [Candidatus Omnitrophota bacterium]
MPKNRIGRILHLLKKEYPGATTALLHKNTLQLLVATILSAQCTDKRVNIVTGPLFKKYKTAADFASANLKTFESQIRSTGFYHSKAKNIIGSAKIIVEKFKGRVPDSMEKLIELPGVARKTANIVLSHGYGKIEGIAVDTHVRRLSLRLGLTKNEDPVKIEVDLMKITPKKDWPKLSDLLIAHGRAICVAAKPKCLECVLGNLCPSKKIFYHK